MKKCLSCGRNCKEFASFMCPSCLNTEVVRCYSCREVRNAYTCGGCGFVGP
ncbi:MAG: RNA-binding protein [Candidatus Micrarchaeota archaeon]